MKSRPLTASSSRHKPRPRPSPSPPQDFGNRAIPGSAYPKNLLQDILFHYERFFSLWKITRPFLFEIPAQPRHPPLPSPAPAPGLGPNSGLHWLSLSQKASPGHTVHYEKLFSLGKITRPFFFEILAQPSHPSPSLPRSPSRPRPKLWPSLA